MTISKSSKFAVIIFALVLFINQTYAKSKAMQERSLQIAGLVVDAKSLDPIDKANIYDAEGHLLGATNDKGYYNVSVKVAPTGEILFSLKIRKDGYKDINQNDHWGNLPGGSKAYFYFGLKKKGSNAEPFSTLVNSSNTDDLSYEHVKSHFINKIQADRSFADKLEKAKTGNQNVLLQIDDSYYIVDNSGWIKLNSSHELVSIDKKQVVTADKLNGILKRKNIKMMTPVSSPSAQFEIDTK